MNDTSKAPLALTIIGAGRLGRSIAAAPVATDAAPPVLLGRDFATQDLSDAVLLLCVPDREIGAVAASIRESGNLPHAIGHTSGATTLDVLDGCDTGGGRFSVHPLQTVPSGETDLSGSPAAIAASTKEAMGLATQIARGLGMEPFRVDEHDRALYHAAASVASNFLITLEETAASMLAGIGIDEPRRVLAPLVRQSLENWTTAGAGALTGPIVRGDVETVARHREAISSARPELLGFYDNLAERTREVAGINPGDGATG